MSTNRQQITAIIYDKRGRVISVGQNSYVKTHPMQAKYARQVGEDHKIYLHAEIAAIAKCKNLKKAEKMLVMRFGVDGKPMLAKPCRVCASAIAASGIPYIEHT